MRKLNFFVRFLMIVYRSFERIHIKLFSYIGYVHFITLVHFIPLTLKWRSMHNCTMFLGRFTGAWNNGRNTCASLV